jgi:hypothetical protein
MSAAITTGDGGIVIIHTLKKDGVSFSIPSNAVVTCRLVDSNHKPLTDSVIQSNTTVGADWFNSKVAIILPGDITKAVVSAGVSWRNGKITAKMETQVDDNGKLTWFHPIGVYRGTID